MVGYLQFLNLERTLGECRAGGMKVKMQIVGVCFLICVVRHSGKER